MAVTDINDYVAKCTDANAQIAVATYTPYVDAGSATTASATANVWLDYFQINHYPHTGSGPGTTARQCTLATAGAIQFTNPGGGRKKYITGIQIIPHNNFNGLICLVDRLLDVSGLSGTSIVAQTVGGTIPRYNTDALSRGNVIMPLVWDAAIGASATTVSASYTKEDGTTSGRTTKLAVFGGAGNQERLRATMLPLADGDLGVRAVASVTLTATTGTAGNFGCAVVHPLLEVAIQSGSAVTLNCLTQLGYMPEVKTDACLTFMVLPTGTTVPEFTALIGMIEST